MRSIKAFVAKSFDPRDEPKTRQVEGILDSFRPLGVQWETAEPAEIESVSEKVRRKIDECDLFVGIFTRRHPIYDQTTADLRHPTANQPVAWTGPPWLFQESGYALKAGKKLMLFLENQVEFPMLTGDLEYIPLNSELPAGALKKAAEVLSDLIAQTAGIELRTLVSGPATNTVIGDATSGEQPLVVEITRPPSLRACIEELIEAEFDKDESRMDRAEGEGLEVIRSGMAEAVDEITWRCLCLTSRGRTGDTIALQKLHSLSTEHPNRPEPLVALASVAEAIGEYETAGRWYSKAADFDGRHRVKAAEVYRLAKRADLAREQLELALTSTTAELKVEILKQMFWVYKESEDPVGAFCFGEAALRLQPNDLGFRFELAHAYGDSTGAYSEHDYCDLALFHYTLLLRARSAIEYADNNLGVAYDRLGAPIHAVERYKAGSVRGNALATSNLIRQYLSAGFVDDAKAWAEAHTIQEDEQGHIAQALARAHSLRAVETEKLQAILAPESQHRSALADLAGTITCLGDIEGWWKFPEATIELSVKNGQITGAGEGQSIAGTVKHQLSASQQNGIWRLEKRSHTENNFIGGESRSYGLMGFLPDGKSALVLEYRSGDEIATYRVWKATSSESSDQSVV